MEKAINSILPKTKKQWIGMIILMAIAVTICTMMIPVMAANSPDPGAIVAKFVDIIMNIFLYIGILLAVWSVGMLVLAFKNEDGDSKSRAMMMLVVSCMLIGIKVLVATLDLTSYLTSGGGD